MFRFFKAAAVLGYLSISTALAQSSDIIAKVGYTYPTNIDYATFQEPTNIVNNNGLSILVAGFTIRDGGAAGTDAGSNPTTLTTITFDLGSNWQMFRRIELRMADDSAPLGTTGTNEQDVTAQSVVFTGLSQAAPDNNDIDFQIRVSFQNSNTVITDNSQFQFTITAATATGSAFAASNAGGASTSISGDNNRIEATASKTRFVQGPTNVTVNTVMAPSVTIEATDANNVRDLDNGSTITVTSTGTLTGTTAVAASSGLATFAALTHTVIQTGRTLSATAATPPLTGVGPSSAFNVTTGSSISDIIVNSGFTYPTDIAYDAFQETNITVASPVVAKFDLRDGGVGASDADGFTTTLTDISFTVTNNTNLRRMAIYDAAGTTELAEVAVSSGTVTFTGLTIAAADNGSASFTVLASFNDPVTDNQQFSLTVNTATALAGGSEFASANAGGAVTSTSGNNNKIEVTATKLAFIQGPTSSFTGASMTPAVTIESIDALDNRDLDNTSAVAVTSTGTLTGSPVSQNAVAGLATFSTLTHTAAGANLTLSAAATVPTLTGTGPSSTFIISAGSDVIVSGFTLPQNIDYASFQIGNITNTTNGVKVAEFIIRDGGGLNDAGTNTTVMTNLTIDLGPNWAVVRRLAIFNQAGATQATGAGSEIAVSGQTVAFSGMSGAVVTAADNGSTTFSVLASFQDPVTTPDNLQFSLTTTAGTATGSVFGSPWVQATTSTASDNNRIEVTATKLLFVQPPTNVVVLAAMSPAVTIEGVDVLDSRDLDFGASVSVSSSGTLTGDPVSATAASGLATFSTLTHTVIQTNRTLAGTSSGLATTGNSSNFNVTGSSDIIVTAGFTYLTDIAYDQFQETDITVASPLVASFDLRDGGGTTDGDATGTTLTDISFTVTNPANLRRMAIYDAAGTTELAEMPVSSGTVAFTGLTILAGDGANTTFTIRVSFNDPVTDNQNFRFTVASAAALGGGSQFKDPDAGGAQTSTAGTNNKIEVLATKLLFVQQPSTVGINVNMAPAVTIEAVDALDNRDLDNGSSVAVTSTGTLTGTPVTQSASSGLATFSALQHSAAGTGFTLSATATTPSLTGVGPSNTFTVIGGSDVVTDGTFTYPTNIAYNNFQATDITSTANGVIVARFIIRDGGGVPDAGGNTAVMTNLTIDLGLNWTAIRRLAIFNSAGSTQATGTSELTVSGQTVAFTGMSGAVVTAADNGNTTISILATFQDPMTDNLQFSLTTTAGTATGSPFASPWVQATTSIAGDDNRIEVLASKLLFAQVPTNVEANAVMAPAVTIESVDNLDNRDLDNASAVAVTSNGTLTGSPVGATAVNGLATFSTLTHTVAQTARTLSATALTPSLTGVASTTFNVTGTSDIIATVAFPYPTNIAYETLQESDITIASPLVAGFDLRDGSGGTDGDALATTLTDISFTVSNFGFIRRMALYDAAGTAELAEVAVSSGTVTFTGLNIQATDGASTSFTVRASFNTTVTDNQQFQLTVNSATATPGNSQFTLPTAGAATSSVSSDDNRVEVTATKLRFVQQPSNVFINTAMTPAVTIEATDANNNRDLDNGSTVAVSSTGTIGGTTSVAASSGLATFSNIQHSVAGTGLTLSATAATPSLTAVGPSNTFFVSAGSDIIANTGFTYPINILYAGFQQNTDIQSPQASSVAVARFDVRDGGGVTDSDVTATTVTGITLDMGANFATFRRVALFDAAGTTQLGGTSEVVAGGAQNLVFSSLTGLSAADNGSTSFTVRVSFRTNVTDNSQFTITINSTTTSAGSSFAVPNAGAAFSSTAGDNNRIEVVATKLNWFQQPPAIVFQGGAMTPAVSLESVDANDIRDLDNTSNITLTSTGLPNAQGSTLAVNGLATFASIIHTTQNTGRTLAASAASPALTASGNSSLFDIVAPGSDVIANASFVYTANIPYDNYQVAGNITNSGTSLVVAKFDVRDGSGTSDGDALPTTLTDLTLNLGTNFGVIRRIALYDAAGTTELTGTNEQDVLAQSIIFSGLSVAAPDNGSLSFTVRVSFQDPITDNLQFSFTVTSATALGTGSLFASGNAGGAVSSTATDNNRIEVTATTLAFVQNPTDTYINVGMAPSVTIQAADNLGNRDLDNVSSISVSSSGTLVGAPVPVLAVSGLATFPTLTHSAAGTALTLSATSTGPILTPSGNSATFDIFGPSNASDIIANAGFAYTSNVAYETFQEASDIVNSASSLVAAKFDIRDGGGAADGDPFPTQLQNLTLDLGPNFAYIRRIALYDAAGTVELGGVNEQAVGSQFMGFSGLTLSATDGGSTSFTVRVSFTNAVVDNQQFSFTVNSTATLGTNSSMAAINGGGAVSSTATDFNRIEVTATKMRFVQGPTSTFINTNMSPAVTVEAVDPLNNRDLDNTSSVDITSTGTLTGSPANASVAIGTGLATFATLQHSAAGIGLTLSATSTAPVLTTTGASTTFGISDGSDIALDPAFVPVPNIPYDVFQESINITNIGTSLVAQRFFLRDGGAAPVDPDASITQLTDLVLDLGPNFNLIRRIALYNNAGNIELPAAIINEQNVVAQTVSFHGLTLNAPDNGQIGFTVRVSFNAPVVDNLQFSFTVTSATAFGLGSQFAQTNAGGATTSLAGDNNRVEVTATRMAFVQQPTNAFINVGITPSVTAETVDNLNSRDLDYATNVSITSSGTLTGSPVTIAAINGLATFPGLAHSVAQINRDLTAASGGLTSALSSAFNILPPSNSSNIIVNGGFLHPSNIAYNTSQEPADIVNSATSLIVAKFDVQDGGGAADADAFPTVMTNITLDLGANFGLIRRIALYDAAGTTELPATLNEQAVVATNLISFTGLTVSAPDNGSISFTVRVSFQDPVTDNLQFSVKVNNTATLAINSSFNVPSAGGAVTPTGAVGVVDANRIEVTATKLLFVQGPTNAFINVAMTPAVTIEAVDPLDNRDLDYVTNVSVTSTGTLTGTPVVVAPISGLVTFPALAHSVAQAGRTIAATSGVLTTTGPSATFSILAPIALSNIILDGTFVHPPNIAYNTFQENTDIVNSTTSLVVGRFIVQDGGGAADADAFPTVMTNLTLDLGPNFGLINRIALFDAAGTTQLTGVSEQAVTLQTVSFSGLTVTAPDNLTTTFTVRVSFKNAVTDNLQFSVLVSNTATVATNSSFAAANAGGAVTPTGAVGIVDANRIEVTATLLRFTTNFNSPLLAAKDIAPVQQPAAPVIRAEDVLQNVDLDYGSMGTITCALSVTPSINITAVAGVFSFPSTFQFLQTGIGTITFNAPSLTGVVSNPVTVNAGTATTITPDLVTPPPATISSLINTIGAATHVFSFIVNDDPAGTLANNDDGLPTLITQIVITQNNANNDILLADWTQAIGGATLSDGVNPAITATAISATSISFGGISTAPGQLGNIPDNTPKTYTLRIFLKGALGGTLPTTIDGKKFEFKVLGGVGGDVTLATTGSTNIIGGESQTSGNANAVAVLATALRFTSPTSPPNPNPMNVSLDTDFPGVAVEATDANFNRDLNYTAGITALTNVTGVSTSPAIVGNNFAAGVYAFPSNFRFTSGSSGNPVGLTITAGFTTSSIGLTLLSSSESSIVNDPTFTYPTQLQYIQHQATNIDITTAPLAATSVEIARMLLIDGNRNNAIYGASTVSTGTASDLTVNGDDDGADTRLTSITLRVTNPSNLRRIAIYNGSTELGEINVQTLGLAHSTSTYDFLFSGGPTLLVAPDNNLVPASGIVPISVRVSFMDNAAQVVDGDLINVSVFDAQTGTGSNFFALDGAAPVNLPSGGPYQSPTTPSPINRLNVTATNLDFFQQPGTTAGVNEPVTPAAIVHARDANVIVDTDFGFAATVSSQGTATTLGSFGFTAGVLNMNGLLTYGSPGIGTLTVTTSAPAPVLSSLTSAVPCTRVDVIHVTTIRQNGGVVNPDGSDQVSVLAGTNNVVFFGFSFNAGHNFAGDPKVTKFTFTFNNSYAGVLSNFRVFESTANNLFSSALPVNPLLVTTPTSTTVTVDFTAAPKDLAALPNLTYFLMADVSVFVGGATPNLKVSIVDGGVGSLTQNNIQVLGNVGSQSSNTSGATYVFASVAPPTLVGTYPRIAQTNVDPAQATIEMTFSVPVFTSQVLGATLWKKVPGFPDVQVANLSATNGFPFNSTGLGSARPIIFSIVHPITGLPVSLVADTEYYVLVPAGSLSPPTGIVDQSQNLFPGISYSGTFFFRTGNTTGPSLLSASATDITNGGATINATFDKIGQAYYIVSSTNIGGTPPTYAEIIGGTWASNTVVASGQFPINVTHTIPSFGTFSVPGGFVVGTHHVWITAESTLEKKVGASIITSPHPACPTCPLAYGSGPSFAAGGAGPTFNFPAPGPSPTPLVLTNNATIAMCSNSFQILSSPIIIYEGTNPGQTFQNPSPDQTFNIVLPAGFAFDDTPNPVTGKPLYASVSLIGGDFLVNSQTVSFLSTSVLKITFTNTGSSTLDRIVISNLRIKSDGARSSSSIFRLGGTGIPAINDGAVIARLSAQESNIVRFDNSYSISLGQTLPTFTETAIPDNATPALVQLIPYVADPADFGPTSFSGQGVNVNELNVNGVTKDVPFNITVVHMDQNGCISDNPVQFVVYDNKRAVIIKNPAYDPLAAPPGTPVNPANLPISLDQSPYAASISEFKINQQIPSGALPSVVRDVTYDNLGAYYMASLTTAIPPGTPTTIINPTSLSGAWNAIVAALAQPFGAPVVVNSIPYQNYKFDDRQIVNAHALNATIPYIYDYTDNPALPPSPTNAYVFKRDIASTANPNYPQGITYYTGGSLGKVEFTGTFNNIANPVVIINRRQIVEFYLPAVPALEFVTPASFLINGENAPVGGLPIPPDPANPPSSTPLSPQPNKNNPGTFVYCEQGGSISIAAWPKPDLASGSTGTFKIYDAANYTINPATATPLAGLTDNGVGTANINPIVANAAVPGVHVAYSDIRVVYTFNDGNDSENNATTYTASTKASQVFRIVPNPTALFSLASNLPNPYVSGSGSYCVGQPITFDPSASIPGAGGGSSIQVYSWNFDDPSNALPNNPNPNLVSGIASQPAIPGPPIVPAGGTNKFPVHTFSSAKTFNPMLTIVSNFGCPSPPAFVATTVGAIPVVISKVDGTHAGPGTGQTYEFHFQSNGSTHSLNDSFSSIQWNFGDSTGFGPPIIYPADADYNLKIKGHNYTNANVGQRVYDMKITTANGCVNSLYLTNNLAGITDPDNALMRTLVVLPRFTVTAANAYFENFEPPIGADVNAPLRIWQPWITGAFQPAPSVGTTPARSVDPTWVKGTPTGAALGSPDAVKFTPTVNGANIWTTALAGTYSPFERSAIYSPSLDLSALLRPMISFDTYADMKGGDGVVLQFSIDNKNITDPTKVWETLGTTTDGEFWYTDQGLSAKPGDQAAKDYGWSTKSVSWQSSRHALSYDSIPATCPTCPPVQALINKKRVIFRLAMASNASSVTIENGFGFDNPRIGERTRTILLETFTNTSNEATSPFDPSMKAEKYENTVIQGFNSGTVGLEVVKLNYHVNFPGNDPFNKTNPADPSSRALFYSVSQTPASRLDGYAPAPYTQFSQWGGSNFSTRTLRLAQADILIRPIGGGSPSTITSSGKILFEVVVTPTVTLDSKTILHVGLVEQQVPLSSLADPSMVKTGETSFDYVVKKLLPTASGTRTGIMTAALPTIPPSPPNTFTFGPFEWDPILSNFHSPNTGDLAVIAFLQREDGDREVYQAEIVLSLDDPPANMVTGVEPIRAEQVLVYPNPANHEMTIQMPGPLANPARLSLIDQTGRESLTGSIPEGADRKTLDVGNLSSGVYILTVDMGQGVLARKKVIVVHQD